MPAAYHIESLGSHYKRKDFSCGVPALDHYLHELATQDVRRKISNCFVVCDDADSVVAYYTFSAASFHLSDLPPDTSKRLPHYPLLPAGLIGRLAVDERFRGKGLGSALVIDASRRAIVADTAIYALIVDAKDEMAVTFYEHLGFRQFTSKPKSLFLPIATAIKAMQSK